MQYEYKVTITEQISGNWTLEIFANGQHLLTTTAIDPEYCAIEAGRAMESTISGLNCCGSEEPHNSHYFGSPVRLCLGSTSAS